jgi:small subunit ribosomal protein S9
MTRKESPYVWSTGRRKSAVARVRLLPGGSGRFFVNKREFKAYFTTLHEQRRVLAPLKAVGQEAAFDVFASTAGGGYASQSGAISMGLARALLKHNPEFESTLRDGKYLTRDAREKERKKYGRRGARRGFQFSKR